MYILKVPVNRLVMLRDHATVPMVLLRLIEIIDGVLGSCVLRVVDFSAVFVC